MRIVRSFGVFPLPDIPIIMFAAHGEFWRVLSGKARHQRVSLQAGLGQIALLDRFLSIALNA